MTFKLPSVGAVSTTYPMCGSAMLTETFDHFCSVNRQLFTAPVSAIIVIALPWNPEKSLSMTAGVAPHGDFVPRC